MTAKEWSALRGALRKKLGPRAFDEDKGHFWGLLETRPYMRARTELAWLRALA